MNVAYRSVALLATLLLLAVLAAPAVADPPDKSKEKGGPPGKPKVADFEKGKIGGGDDDKGRGKDFKREDDKGGRPPFKTALPDDLRNAAFEGAIKQLEAQIELLKAQEHELRKAVEVQIAHLKEQEHLLREQIDALRKAGKGPPDLKLPGGKEGPPVKGPPPGKGPPGKGPPDKGPPDKGPPDKGPPAIKVPGGAKP
jgi:hypothetical protein